jgi:hypothetical protein
LTRPRRLPDDAGHPVNGCDNPMANPNPGANWKGKRVSGGPGRPKGSPNRLTRERVEQELRHLALFDPRKLLGRTGKMTRTFTLRDIADLPDDVAACISSYDVVLGNQNKSDDALETVIKVRWYDKTKALELCCRSLGMLKDQVSLSASDDLLARLDAWKLKRRKPEDA